MAEQPVQPAPDTTIKREPNPPPAAECPPSKGEANPGTAPQPRPREQPERREGVVSNPDVSVGTPPR